MREIKFRAWDGKSMIMNPLGFLELYPLNSLMQFTGLQDKNGKDIYEGDIVEFQYYEIELKDHVSCGVVEWAGAGFRLGKMVNVSINDKHSLEVIGNIYTNPELISAN